MLAVALYYARMFFLTAGYHRYFSHRAFKVSRAVQCLLAAGRHAVPAEGAAVVGR